jgi:hypothetical protein
LSENTQTIKQSDSQAINKTLAVSQLFLRFFEIGCKRLSVSGMLKVVWLFVNAGFICIFVFVDTTVIMSLFIGFPPYMNSILTNLSA